MNRASCHVCGRVGECAPEDSARFLCSVCKEELGEIRDEAASRVEGAVDRVVARAEAHPVGRVVVDLVVGRLARRAGAIRR